MTEVLVMPRQAQSGHHVKHGKWTRAELRAPFMAGYWAAIHDANPYCGINFIRESSDAAFVRYVNDDLRLDPRVKAYVDDLTPEGKRALACGVIRVPDCSGD